ncbi:hypothetical protein KC930_01695 [Candidatus Saccharibacteria bacterium]|nr:hypothetical protein [Candidatus Saccharibacteria bacterium]
MIFVAAFSITLITLLMIGKSKNSTKKQTMSDEDLKKLQETDEHVAVILPIIRNDK